MGFDVLGRVVAYGIIPTVFAVAGIYLAAETVPKPRQGRIKAIFIIVAIVGTGAIWWVEDRADSAHAREIAESRAMSRELKTELGATRIEDGKQLAALHSDLDAMIKGQPDVAKKIAEGVGAVTSALIKKQADAAAAASDAELKSKTLTFVADLRGFTKEIQGRLGWTADSTSVTAGSSWTADSGVLLAQDGSVLTAQSGQPLLAQRRTAAKSEVLEKAREEFNEKYRIYAVQLRSQLISRLGGVPPELAILASYRLIGFEGSLTGPESIGYVADYLEALANKLPDTRAH